MKRLFILLTVLGLSLSGCRDNSDDVYPDNLSGGSGSGDDNGGNDTASGRSFACTSTQGAEPVRFIISNDQNTVTLNPESDNLLYTRNDEPDDSDSDADSLIEYSRISIPENPDEIKLSGPLVNGAASGRLLINNLNYTCTGS